MSLQGQVSLGKEGFRWVGSLRSGGGSFTGKRRRRGGQFFAVAEVSQRARRRANNALHATWLIGALFEFFHPHCGRFAGEGSRAAPAKRVKAAVRLFCWYSK